MDTRDAAEGTHDHIRESAEHLLVLDVQNGVVEGTHERDAVVAASAAWSRRRGTNESPSSGSSTPTSSLRRERPMADRPRLNPDDSEPLVEKSYGDSFEDTTLESVLSGLGRATRRRRRSDR